MNWILLALHVKQILLLVHAQWAFTADTHFKRLCKLISALFLFPLFVLSEQPLLSAPPTQTKIVTLHDIVSRNP